MKFNKGDILVPRDVQFLEGAVVVDGYDEDWNGWATPRFEFAEAQRLIGCLKEGKARFDSERDAFITISQDGEEKFWQGQSVCITDGSSIKVYPIGAGSWCWNEVELKVGD